MASAAGVLAWDLLASKSPLPAQGTWKWVFQAWKTKIPINY